MGMDINNYIDFITESKLDLILESNIVYTKEFRKALRGIESTLSDKLKNIEGNDVDITTNYIEINPEKDDTINFIPDNQLRSPAGNLRRVGKIKRNEIKIGRFIRRLLTKVGEEFTDSEIEDFVNKYKSYINLKNKALNRVSIVSGEDIRKYYLFDSYSNIKNTLGSSCMRYPKCQPYLDIYVNNPEYVSLIILKNMEFDDKIDGRALLWILDDGRKFMDRIYKTEESQDNLFIKFARKNGIYYKSIQHSRTDFNLMFDGKVSEENPNLRVELDGRKHYNTYPYMDTLKYYDPNDGTLRNKMQSDNYDILTLEEVNGGDGSCSSCGGTGESECGDCDGEKRIECYDCGGSGETECWECDGNGYVDCDECDGRGDIDCDECGGSGEDGEGHACTECGGKGIIDCGDCSGGEVDCPDCDSGHNECDECDGRGDNECGECGGEGTVNCYDCG